MSDYVEESLFNPKLYNSPETTANKHKTDTLMAIFGLEKNFPLYDSPRYYAVSVLEGSFDVYHHTGVDGVAQMSYKENSGSVFDENVELVTRQADATALYQGFIHGIVDVTVGEKKETAVHLFGSYDDIYGSDVVIPLSGISEVYRYPNLYANLLAHLHGMYDDKSNVYQVEVLKNSLSGESIYRPATYDEIKKTIGDLALRPTLQYSVENEGIFSPTSKPRPKEGYVVE